MDITAQRTCMLIGTKTDSQQSLMPTDLHATWNLGEQRGMVLFRLVLRSTHAFFHHISNEILQYPVVKDSVANMVGALKSILKFRSQQILRLLACATAVNIVLLKLSSRHDGEVRQILKETKAAVHNIKKTDADDKLIEFVF